MEDNSSTASNIYMDQKLEYMKALINGMQAKLEGDEQRYPPLITEGILQLSSEVDTLRKISKRLEEDRKSLRALAQIGQVVKFHPGIGYRAANRDGYNRSAHPCRTWFSDVER